MKKIKNLGTIVGGVLLAGSMLIPRPSHAEETMNLFDYTIPKQMYSQLLDKYTVLMKRGIIARGITVDHIKYGLGHADITGDHKIDSEEYNNWFKKEYQPSQEGNSLPEPIEGTNSGLPEPVKIK